MAAPKTFVLEAPTKIDEGMGRCIMSADLVRGLHELNSDITAWEQYNKGLWWPGKETGLSCIWRGQPGGKSKKITAFKNGPIPEWSQRNPDGSLFCKGWRAIFQKVITSKSAPKASVEAKFNVILDLDQDYDPEYCRLCRKMNKWVKTDGGVDRLCRMHALMRAKIQKFYGIEKEKRDAGTVKLSN